MLKLAEAILFGVLAWNKIYTAVIMLCCAPCSPGSSMHSLTSVALCRDGIWAHEAASEGTQQEGSRYLPAGSSAWAMGSRGPEELPHTEAQLSCTKSFDSIFKTVLPVNHIMFSLL